MNPANEMPMSISTPYIDPVQESTTINKKIQIDMAEVSREDPTAIEKLVHPDEEDLPKIVSNVNQFVRDVSQKVSFTYDDRSDRPIIIVEDNDTGEVIRQIPPDEMLNLMAKLEDIAGIIFHRKA